MGNQETRKEFSQSTRGSGKKKKIATPNGTRFKLKDAYKGSDAYTGRRAGGRDPRKPLPVGKDTWPKERRDGKGLTVYIPRKRKPKVAFPKGWDKRG